GILVLVVVVGRPPQSTPFPTRRSSDLADLAAALRRLPGGEFARFVSGAGTPGPAGSRISRRDGEPDAGAYEELDWDANGIDITRSEEHTSELQSRGHLVCRLLLETKKP